MIKDNEPTEQPVKSTDPLVTKTKKFKFIISQHTFEILAIFLAGMVASACLLFGAYYVMLNKDDYITKQPGSTSYQPYVQSDVHSGKKQITQEDLSQYVDMKDCSLDSQFEGLEIAFARTKMKAIDLESATLTVGANSTTNYVEWSELPAVVDSNCKPLKMTDIKAGDTLNLYTKSTDPDGLDIDSTILQLIQKAA